MRGGERVRAISIAVGWRPSKRVRPVLLGSWPSFVGDLERHLRSVPIAHVDQVHADVGTRPTDDVDTVVDGNQAPPVDPQTACVLAPHL